MSKEHLEKVLSLSKEIGFEIVITNETKNKTIEKFIDNQNEKVKKRNDKVFNQNN